MNVKQKTHIPAVTGYAFFVVADCKIKLDK